MKALISTALIGIAMAGCTLAGPLAPTISVPAEPTPSPLPSPTPAPAATTASPPPTVSPPLPSAIPSQTASDDEWMPPVAVLTLPDGSSHPATIGSYVYRETYADSPYWPTASSMTRITLPAADTTLTVELPDVGFVEWRASYADRNDHQADDVAALDSGGDGDAGVVVEQAQFAPPPGGSWLLEVSLVLPDEEGTVNYYWLVAVPRR